ncbi:MAG: BrnT family toxin, partial [Chloroflexaceae bacterium]|nr:BrnT family toxin [Chloroflexaceae bacterium]
DYEDTRYNYGEERFIAIGESQGRVLAVTYTWRGDTIRIISARKATKNETREYYSSYQ